MSGDFPPDDPAGLKHHLEECTACRRYRDEISSVTTLLAAAGEVFADLEPGKATQMRWARDFEAAVEPPHSITARVLRAFLDWSRDMVLPCRRIWAGMVAIWVLVLGLNAWQNAEAHTQNSHRPSPEMLRALLAREGFLSGSGRVGGDRDTEPPRPPSPQRGSEHHRESKPS